MPNHSFNTKLSEVTPSGTIAFADYVRGLEAQGKPMYKLQTGDPDFTTCRPLIEAAYQKMLQGETHYIDSTGLPALKTAIVQKLASKNGYQVDTNQVLVTTGAIHGLSIALQALLNPGDEVICVEPCWMPYLSIAKLFGAQTKLVWGDYPHSRESVILENILQAISPKTKVIILNSPSNPSGKVLDKSFWECLLRRIKDTGIYVIADEVYEDFIYTQKAHVSPASLGICTDQIISLYSFSKSYAMAGWRVGYVVAQAPLIALMQKALQYTVTCVPPFVQGAALEALTNPAVQQEQNKMIATFAKRAEFITQSLRGVTLPEGAFYVLLDISHLGMDCMQAARFIAETYQVALAPGIIFGSQMHHTLRLSFAVSQAILGPAVARLQHAGL